MNYSDYFNIVLRMLSDGSEPYEIFDELSKFGLRENEIDEILSVALRMLVAGYDTTQIIFRDSYDLKRRVFTEEELEILRTLPGLLKSYVWGEISPSDFEKSLTDFSDFD
ncbi:hypothetical protein AT15_00650 [Kosmotoga arenicorallina S304]|uniref:Uncharacterized protein n=1 Tax=Kosmotoga arenicorallina S304 TaxID=1453497 RepID=A0A176K0R6_9BACT|nr:hypothetical protein [Kosmotoga arenicorallina]OAA30055.1 hypothetical protein AT15_00650 [Kosmotoga arenicorallina S304]